MFPVDAVGSVFGASVHQTLSLAGQQSLRQSVLMIKQSKIRITIGVLALTVFIADAGFPFAFLLPWLLVTWTISHDTQNCEKSEHAY